MKKRMQILALMISLLLFSGCGNKQETASDADRVSETDMQQAEITITESAKPTEEPIQTATPEPTEKPEPTATPEPTPEPTQEPHNHAFENYIYNNDASYLADGTETATCVCGETDTRVVSGSRLVYSFAELNQIMYAKSDVNVRDLPSTDGNKLGGLCGAQEVQVTGQCVETGWYRIVYGAGVGYVSDSYIVADKPVAEVATPDTTQAGTPAGEVCPYTLYVIQYDALGYPYFYGKWGGSANMDADNWAKTDACMRQMSAYVSDHYMITNADGTGSCTSVGSWKLIGTYQGMPVVVRYVEVCNEVNLGTPEARGIPTAGNGIWQ